MAERIGHRSREETRGGCSDRTLTATYEISGAAPEARDGPGESPGQVGTAPGVPEAVRARAVEVFESVDVAELWLDEPNPALGGRRPAELAGSAAGRRAVERVLSRIEHGDYS